MNQIYDQLGSTPRLAILFESGASSISTSTQIVHFTTHHNVQFRTENLHLTTQNLHFATQNVHF